MRHDNRKKLMIAFAAFAAVSMSSIQTNRPVLAAETSHTVTAFVKDNPAEDAPALSSEELFAGYVKKQFGNGNRTARLCKNFARTKLQGNCLKIYDLLKTQIEETARGERPVTEYEIPITELVSGSQLEFEAEEAGVTVSRSMSEAQKDALYEKLLGIKKENLLLISSSLMADCPYEMYWYDKASSGGVNFAYPRISVRKEGQRTVCSFTSGFTVSFTVDAGYRDNAADVYRLGTSQIDTVKTAALTAQSIVDQAVGKTDYEKLDFYRQEICRLADYNTSAANGYDGGSKNPWQLIYVFDNKPDTNVVCEGYSKAFQYLCDLTDFDNYIYSYIVYGSVSGGTGEGSGHMWNIVHTDSGNYLADLTNCDAGAVGEADKLFLTGYTFGTPQNGYTIQVSGRNVTYHYDDDMEKIYSAEDLVLKEGGRLREDDLHTHKWTVEESIEATCTEPGKTVFVCTCGEKKTEDLDINPANHAGETEIRNARSASGMTEGYTGDTYCKSCGAKIADGTVIPAAGSSSASWSLKDPSENGSSAPAMAVQAEVSITADNGNPVTLTNDIITQIKEAAGTNAVILVKAEDTDKNSRFEFLADTKDLVPGNQLYIYIKDQAADEYIMVNSKTYTVTADGNISVSAGADKTYRLVNKTQASKINKEILKAVKLKTPSVSVRKGKTASMAFNSGMNTANIKKITYVSSKKSVAEVSADGKITAKKAGSATVRAKVTLKNGSVKTVFMKIKVR